MTRDELLQYIIDLQFVENYTKKLAYSNDFPIIDDEIQEIYLQLCEVRDEKWQELLAQGTKGDAFKAVRGFISGLIYRNVRSMNSKLYYRLKRHGEREILADSEQWRALEELPDE